MVHYLKRLAAAIYCFRQAKPRPPDATLGSGAGESRDQTLDNSGITAPADGSKQLGLEEQSEAGKEEGKEKQNEAPRQRESPKQDEASRQKAVENSDGASEDEKCHKQGTGQNYLAGQEAQEQRLTQQQDNGLATSDVKDQVETRENQQKPIEDDYEGLNETRKQDDALRHQLWLQDFHLSGDPHKADFPTRLAEHESIMDRLLSFCFPGDSVHIFEYPYGVDIPGVPSNRKDKFRGARMKYKVFDRNAVEGITSKLKHDTTYFGSLEHQTPTRPNLRKLLPENTPRQGLGGCTGLLRVRKDLSAVALQKLYGRPVHLQCSAVGAREFLLAHKDQMRLSKQLVLYYH